MGAIADAIVAYAQPLLDVTDGSEDQVRRAFLLSQLCFNLALVPEDRREPEILDMRLKLQLDDEEFDAFRRSVVGPMIERHQEMFPGMHMRGSTDFSQDGPSPSGFSFPMREDVAARREAYPGTGRYAPCPCNSGEKYKFCCGRKRL